MNKNEDHKLNRNLELLKYLKGSYVDFLLRNRRLPTEEDIRTTDLLSPAFIEKHLRIPYTSFIEGHVLSEMDKMKQNVLYELKQMDSPTLTDDYEKYRRSVEVRNLYVDWIISYTRIPSIDDIIKYQLPNPREVVGLWKEGFSEFINRTVAGEFREKFEDFEDTVEELEDFENGEEYMTYFQNSNGSERQQETWDPEEIILQYINYIFKHDIVPLEGEVLSTGLPSVEIINDVFKVKYYDFLKSYILETIQMRENSIYVTIEENGEPLPYQKEGIEMT